MPGDGARSGPAESGHWPRRSRALNLPRALRSPLLVSDEDAEGVTVEVCEDAQWFLRVIAAIEPHRPSEGKDALMHGLQLVLVAYGQIHMELLGHVGLRPRRTQKRVDLLEGEERGLVWRPQVEPVGARRVLLAGDGLLVPGSVVEREQLSPELGTASGMRSVEHDLT